MTSAPNTMPDAIPENSRNLTIVTSIPFNLRHLYSDSNISENLPITKHECANSCLNPGWSGAKRDELWHYCPADFSRRPPRRRPTTERVAIW